MAKKKKKIPVYIDYDTGTTFIQDTTTGLLRGRRPVRGFGDRTAVRRVKKNFGKFESGQIVGRTNPIKKSVLVRKHAKKSKKGKPVSVKSHKRRIR